MKAPQNFRDPPKTSLQPSQNEPIQSTLRGQNNSAGQRHSVGHPFEIALLECGHACPRTQMVGALPVAACGVPHGTSVYNYMRYFTMPKSSLPSKFMQLAILASQMPDLSKYSAVT